MYNKNYSTQLYNMYLLAAGSIIRFFKAQSTVKLLNYTHWVKSRLRSCPSSKYLPASYSISSLTLNDEWYVKYCLIVCIIMENTYHIRFF